jgi:hypothetical protein
MTIATLLLHMAVGTALTYIGSVLLIGLTTFVVAFVAYKTLVASKKIEICIEEVH